MGPHRVMKGGNLQGDKKCKVMWAVLPYAKSNPHPKFGRMWPQQKVRGRQYIGR